MKNKNITAAQKRHLIKIEKEAIKAYSKVGLKKFADGEREDLREVRKLKTRK